MRTPKLVVAHNAITETTTSSAIAVADAKKVTIELTEAGSVNNRSGVLTITGSVDGTNFRAFNMLVDNVANTNGQTKTRVLSKTRAAAGTDILSLDLENFAFTHIKAVVTITDGADPVGTFTVKVLVQYN